MAILILPQVRCLLRNKTTLCHCHPSVTLILKLINPNIIIGKSVFGTHLWARFQGTKANSDNSLRFCDRFQASWIQASWRLIRPHPIGPIHFQFGWPWNHSWLWGDVWRPSRQSLRTLPGLLFFPFGVGEVLVCNLGRGFLVSFSPAAMEMGFPDSSPRFVEHGIRRLLGRKVICPKAGGWLKKALPVSRRIERE